MPTALDKLSALRQEITDKGYDILLEVDGGINKETAPLAINAGADVLVAGNFLFAGDMEQNVEFIKSL